MNKRLVILFLSICTISVLPSCKHEIPTLPVITDPGTGPVCFENEVLPIFQSYCAKSGCHDATSAEDNYILDSYTNIIRRGLRPGNAANSELYEVLIENGDDRMPQAPNDPLSAAQINTIARWINEGAQNTTGCAPVCDSSSFTYSGNVKPILQTHCLGCHSGVAVDGGFIPLDTYDAVREMVNGNFLLPAIEQTNAYPMPKNSAKISDCKITIIRKWIEAGALNN
jgi:hypothetical protein